jgi:hypothetical protein
MRRTAVPVAILIVVILVPAVALAEPAAPGDTAAVGPGGQDAGMPAPAPAPGAAALAPPGMVPLAPPSAAIDQPAPTAKPTPLALTGVARRAEVDAAGDRVYLLSTAITPRAGTFTATWRAVPAASIGTAALAVGVTDRIQIGAHVLYGDEGDSIEGGSIRAQIYRHAGTAVALEADLLGTDGHDAAGMASATLSQCLDSACGSIASVHAGALVSTDEGEQQVPVLGGVSLIAGAGSFKFIGELLSVEIDHDRLVGGTVGMRIGGRQFAFDLGIAFAGSGDDGGALPVIAVSARP